jgi:hypothetical protein
VSKLHSDACGFQKPACVAPVVLLTATGCATAAPVSVAVPESQLVFKDVPVIVSFVGVRLTPPFFDPKNVVNCLHD